MEQAGAFGGFPSGYMKTRSIDEVPGFVTLRGKFWGILIFAVFAPSLAVGLESTEEAVNRGVIKLRSNDVRTRREGAKLLLNLGSKAKAARSELEKALKDQDAVVRLEAAGVLGAIGPDAEIYIKPLVNALAGSVSTDERVAAFDALCAIGPDSIPALKEVSAGGAIDLRKKAVHCLACIARHKSKEAYLELAKMLSDPNREIRIETVRNLAMVESGAKEAVPALIKVLRGSDSEMRQWATRCLCRIGVGIESAMPELLNGMESPDMELRGLSITALGKIGPIAKSAVPKLISIVRDPGSLVSAFAIEALWRIGGAEAAGVMPELIPLLSDSSQLKSWAKKAVAQLAPYNLPELIKGLKSSDLTVKVEVIEALGKIGPKAKDAVPGLVEIFRGKNLMLRNSSLVALSKIRVGVIPKLLEVLGSHAINRTDGAADALQLETSKAIRAFIRPEDREAIPNIITALSDPNNEICVNLAEALKIVIRPEDEGQDSMSEKIPSNRDPRLRVIKAELLGAIGPIHDDDRERRSICMRLSGLLPDPDARVRLAAIEGLLKIGRESGVVLNEIKNRLNDPDPDVCLGMVKYVALFGARSAIFIPELIRALDNPSAMVRATTAEALGNIGPKGIQAAPKLAEIMNTDKDDLVSAKAEEALMSMGPEAQEIVEKLYPYDWGGK